MADESIHEIQLNGKQLVFTFMAATVVLVVIFLCGVMVGRGVPTARAASDHRAVLADVTTDPTADPTVFAAVPAGTNATDGPITAQETLTYSERLEAPVPPAETLKEQVPPDPVVPETAAEQQAATPPPTPVTSVRSAGVPAEPTGTGWAVQVMAVPAVQRADAEALARRLAAKGYPSYVTPRGNRFAVRVGKYREQREAEAVSARLKKEEQFDPWVTR